mmetsp:Transcript_104641/g.197124  ORF Transcript_104641/g.197124 Transcript_104641/m.197124 type:complete len:728 (+) Transcript_104641:188-2371(+)
MMQLPFQFQGGGPPAWGQGKGPSAYDLGYGGGKGFQQSPFHPTLGVVHPSASPHAPQPMPVTNGGWGQPAAVPPRYPPIVAPPQANGMWHQPSVQQHDPYYPPQHAPQPEVAPADSQGWGGWSLDPAPTAAAPNGWSLDPAAPTAAAPNAHDDNGSSWKRDRSSYEDSNSNWNRDSDDSWKNNHTDGNDSWKKDDNDGSWKKDSWSQGDGDGSWKKSGGWSRARIQEWKQENREREQKELEEEEAKWEAVDPGPAQANANWAFRKSDDVVAQASIQSRRAELEITVQGEPEGQSIAPFSAFADFNGAVPEYVMTALGEAGMSAPMPIQAQTLPITLRGYDLIGIAKTGSGKTMAFVLPAIAHIEAQTPIAAGEKTPMALVLCPVRELAVQIANEANKLLWKSNTGNHPEGIGAVALYGGGFRIRNEQIREMDRGWCQLVVATPGRAVDLMGAGELVLNRVTYFVLDEADRMLEGGFEEQMNQIAGDIRTDRQTLFFSATWPLQVRKLARNMCAAQPMRVTVGQVETGSGPTARADIVQEIVVFDGDSSWQDVEKKKHDMLYAHLRRELQVVGNKILVFVNMKNLAWELAGKLGEEGFSCDFMYGGRSQDARHEVIAKFKAGTTKLLVTTDVMARGLDIPGISHVVIFDMYGGIEEYVHRIGRTCRGLDGKGGHALSFFEYDHKFPEMAGELAAVLQSAGQVVPPELQKIADEVASGVRSKKKQKWKY